jgi:hypothetical protein
MTILITISLGYITIPFIIKQSIKSLDITSVEEEDDIKSTFPQWTFENTICISSFVHTPPNIYPTIEKHVIEMTKQSNKVEKEMTTILSKAIGEQYHGLLLISANLLGILSSTKQPDIFTLQIVQYDTSILTNDNINKTEAMNTTKSYRNDNYSDTLNLDQLPKPVEIMELCQAWPDSEIQLKDLSKQIYKTASLYGYWDYWRVFEGICNGHHINSQQLLS